MYQSHGVMGVSLRQRSRLGRNSCSERRPDVDVPVRQPPPVGRRHMRASRRTRTTDYNTALFRRLTWEGTVPLEVRVDPKELPRKLGPAGSNATSCRRRA